MTAKLHPDRREVKPIGPNFSREIFAAGLGGLPFTWGENGDVEYDEAKLTPEQVSALRGVYAAHDHTVQPPPRDDRPQWAIDLEARVAALEAAAAGAGIRGGR